MLITAKQLRDKKACSDQVAIFVKEWPEGAKPTLVNCQRAVKLGLDLGWFAESFLSSSAWEAYKKAKASAWKAYDKATASIEEAYKKTRTSAWEAYDKAITSAWEAYDKARTFALYQALKPKKAKT